MLPGAINFSRPGLSANFNDGSGINLSSSSSLNISAGYVGIYAGDITIKAKSKLEAKKGESSFISLENDFYNNAGIVMENGSDKASNGAFDDDPQKGAAEAKKAKAAMESAVKVALAAVVGAVQGAMWKIGECLDGVGNNSSGTSNVDLRDTLNKPWANAGMDGTRIKSGYDVYMEKTYNNCKEKNPDASDSRIYAQIALRAPWEYKSDAIGNYLSNYNWFTSIPKKFALIEKGIFVNSAINNGFDPKTAEIYGNMAGDFSEGMLFETGFTIVGKGLKAASALKSGEVLSEGEIVAGSGIGNLKGTKTSYVKSIDDLKNTENFKDSALKHILEGEINKRGKAVGFHYEGFPTTKGNIIEGTKSLPDELGVYTGRVEVSGIPKTSNGGQSTFFPESWTAQDIVDAINQAYVNKTFVRGNTYIGTLPSGMKIEMFIDQYGNIISAYPKF